ncbi:Gfo/Idh/MocA family protein [Minwuia thermotolerans]|uniref:Gfo/Idh/MocA family oxidoreductase n=1 Tax=Minwuia thermotolerans TaxID=2056226 RepID=A0A2M9FY38_9PROT|nr:Gfo/Idh/MocA family oxidoreductase [Minwuia thermotolerans]PJK28377.1 gfo/Idh/MocA family oxidoreductase [Minwuia thermotolerans]
MANGPVRLGIIGCGIMGERIVRATLAHDPALIRLTALWDPDPAARARLGAGLPDLPFVDDADDVIDRAETVYIASPPAAHLEHARAALAARRAVFTEKPLGVSLEESRDFRDMAGKAERPAAVNFILASAPSVDSVRAWIEQGVVGRPERLEIYARFAQWPRDWQMDAAGWLAKRQEGGFTREVISHFLFLARRFAGPLELQSARAVFPRGDGAETAVEAELTAGGLPLRLTGDVGVIDHADHNLWVLHGSNGSVRIRDWSLAERLMPDGRWAGDPDAPGHAEARPLILKRQVEKLAAMTRGAPHDLASVGEALNVQTVVEGILASG